MIPSALATLLLALAPVRQGEEAQLVSYDLRRVLPRWDAGTEWRQTLLVAPAGDPASEPEWIGGDRYAGLLSFELLDLLNQILGDELRREGREMMVEGDTLAVLAPASLQQQVRGLLEGLEQALAGTLTVRVDSFRLAEGASEPSAVVMSDEEAQRLVASLSSAGSLQRTATLQLSAGRTEVLDEWQRTSYLRDYDVEVAQGMAIFDPQVDEALSGQRLALRALAVPGGAALSVLGLESELEELRELEIDLSGLLTQVEAPPMTLQGPHRLQSPKVVQTAFAFDTFLADGKALALTFDSALGERKVRSVVVLRRLANTLGSYVVRPIPGTNRSLIALDAGLFRPARFVPELELALGNRGRGQVPSAMAQLDFEGSGFLIEWLKARFSIWRPFGPWILVVTDPAWDRDAGAQLDRLVKGVRPRVALTEASFELRSAGARAVRVRLPLLEGSSATVVVGRARTALTDHDAEIAQNAAVQDPQVTSVFEGLVLTCFQHGDLVELRGFAQLEGRSQEFSPGGGLATLERLDLRSLRFDERLRLDGGRTPQRIGSSAERSDSGLLLELGFAPAGGR